jgi:hypothetical protein
MLPRMPTTKAQTEYDGPEELRIFADILPYIGELAISFSRLEKRVTWAVESLLGSTRDEALEMEEFAQNLSSRIKFLELVGRGAARESKTESELERIILALKNANTFRNRALHNSFNGLKLTLDKGKLAGVSVIKERFNVKPEKRPYSITTAQFRAETVANLERCEDIQRWILTVRPNAENRIP